MNTKRGIAAVASVALLALTGCSSTDKGDTESEKFNADTATNVEAWDHFVERAKREGLAKDNWPSEKSDAAETAANLCDRNSKEAVEFFEIERSLYARSDWVKNKNGVIVFLESYCPDKIPTYAAAWAQKPPAPPKPREFLIGIKIREQQCYGSAGCNVIFQIDPLYLGGRNRIKGDWDVTYKVMGAESPIINTFTISDGTASFDVEEMASTPPGFKLKAKAIRVEPSA